MDLQLTDKIALVVGGAGSIGRAVTETLAAEGAVPIVADLPGSLPALSSSPALANVQTVALDVSDESSVRQAVQGVVQKHGRIDILAYLTGLYHAEPIVTLSAADWDRLLDVNLRGAFLVCREVLPIMQSATFGRIVCIASLAGQLGGVVAGAHYAASKAGILSLVKSLARQSGHPGITVNAISPGPVEGGMTADWPEEDRRRMTQNIPLRRFARPQEIADAVAFLASPRTGYIHGARLDINGGVLMD